MSTTEIKLKITIDGKEAAASVKMTDAELQALARSVRSVSDGSRTAGGEIVHSFSNARNVIQGVKETFDVLRSTLAEPIRAFADMEQANISFEVLLGSAEKAKQMLQDLKTLGAQTPLEFTGLQKNAQTLLSFGLAAEDILPTVKMLGDISGGNAQKMESLTLAFAQMTSTGKLMGQDLLQMINAGFNPLQIISEKTGKSIGALKKEMENGTISSLDIAEAFKAATAEGGRFHDMLKRQAGSTGGSLSNFNDALTTMKQQAGGALAVGLTPMLNTVNQIMTALSTGLPTLSGYIGAVGLLGTAFVTLRVTGILPAISSMHLFGASLLSVKGAMISTGIGAAIILLGSLTAKLAEAFNKYKEAKAGLDTALNYKPEAESTQQGRDFAVKNAEAEIKKLNDQKNALWTIIKENNSVDEFKRAYAASFSGTKGGDESLNTYIAKMKEVNQLLTFQQRTIEANRQALPKTDTSVVSGGDNGKSKVVEVQAETKATQGKVSALDELYETEKKINEIEGEKNTGIAEFALKELHRLDKKKLTQKEYLAYLELELKLKQELLLKPSSEVPVENAPDSGALDESNVIFTDILGKQEAFSVATYGANMAFQTLGRTITQTLGSSIRLFKQANSVAQNFLNTLVQTVAELLIMQTVKGLFSLVLGNPFMAGFSMLAEGGVVTSPAAAIIGEAGPEAVIPLAQYNAMQSSAPIVNVNLSGSLDMDLRKLSFRLNKIETLIAKYN